MRVEQRIGQIDRIGQTYDRVWIVNYFYRDTIEDRIYQALKDRINWFEDVVGTLQPILSDVNKITRDLAMLPAERQAAELDIAIRKLREEIDRASLESLDLDDYLHQEEPGRALQSPVTLADLAAMLTQSSATRHLFRPHPELDDAYWLSWRGEKTAVTFSAGQFDNFPDTLHFMSYGSPLLAEIVEAIPAPQAYPIHMARFTTGDNWPVQAWYDLRGTQPKPIDSFNALKQALAAQNVIVNDVQNGLAQQHFTQETEALARTYRQRLAQHGQQQQAVLQARARRLLEQAALIEIALGQQRSLFDSENYPTGFNQEATRRLARHGAVWKWLLVAATNGGKLPLPHPDASDPFYEQIRNEKPERLKARLQQIAVDAEAVVQSWKRVSEI
jgi:hypothetical protein